VGHHHLPATLPKHPGSDQRAAVELRTVRSQGRLHAQCIRQPPGDLITRQELGGQDGDQLPLLPAQSKIFLLMLGQHLTPEPGAFVTSCRLLVSQGSWSEPHRASSEHPMVLPSHTARAAQPATEGRAGEHPPPLKALSLPLLFAPSATSWLRLSLTW